MAATILTPQYSHQQAVQYPYMTPPSPPMDDASKCSLPSISNLLVCAGQGSPTADSFPAQQQQQQQRMPDDSPTQGVGVEELTFTATASTQTQVQSQQAHAARPGTTTQYGGTVLAGGPAKTTLPPSPPMSTDIRFEQDSPARSMSRLSNASNASSNTGSYYFEAPPSMGRADVDPRSMTAAAAASIPRGAASMQATPAYPAPPVAAAFMPQGMASAFFPSMQPTAPQPAQMPGMYYQRPLPQSYAQMPMSMTLGAGAGPNPWHHHYITRPAQPSYHQSNDRYVCQTCQKAFSRPSSLRIHNHSHTGEKPFRCAVRTCGKAFSVRSNMKRHLRGCHPSEAGDDQQSIASSRASSTMSSAGSPGPY